MKKFILSVLVVMFLVNCKNHESYENSVEVVTDEVLSYSDSKSINPEVEGKVFKSNVEINMKVKDAFNIGNQIEENAVINNGFVLKNQFQTQILDSENVKISDDSLKTTDKIMKYNTIVLKIPVEKLKSHLNYALDKGLIINSVEIKNEELTFQKLSNELNLTENNKLKASERVEEKVTKAIISDDIKFATISYNLVQDPSLISYLSERTDTKIYQEINLGLEVKNALKDGIYYFKIFLVFIAQVLPTILAIVVVVFLFKYAKKVLIKYKKRKSI